MGSSSPWQFEADFGFGKRWIHAIGRASSRDKFFGYENKEWKAIEDVKEDDIRMAAFRATRKEGVRGLLGLRSIPLAKLQELGFNTANVRMVNFFTKDVRRRKEIESIRRISLRGDQGRQCFREEQKQRP